MCLNDWPNKPIAVHDSTGFKAGAACFDGAELSVTFTATQGTGWAFFPKSKVLKKDKESEDDFSTFFFQKVPFFSNM